MSDNQPTPQFPTDPTQAASTPAPTNTAKPRKRRRRWLLRAVIGLPIFIGIGLLMMPTILSTSAARSLIVPQLSSILAPNGKLAIDKWNFGWFGGQRIEGIKLYDDQNAVVAHLNVQTGASLWKLARGNYDLGTTTVDGDFDVRIDPVTGRVNVLHIMGTEPKAEEPQPQPQPEPDGAPQPQQDPRPASPAKPPIDFSKVKGTLSANLHGTISWTTSDRSVIPFTKVETGTFKADLNHLEQGVPIDGNLRLVVNDKPAALSIKGTADAIENNVVLTDPNKISADLVARIEQLDLSIANAALAAAGVSGVDVAGLLKGTIVVAMQPGGAASIRAEDNLGIDNLVATAPQLRGDTFRSRRVDVPLNISRAAGSDVITIESAGVRTDVATVGISGTVAQQALQNLAAQKAPGTPGQLVVKADVPSFAAVAKMLPNLTKLQDGVEVTGGGLSNTTTIDLLADSVKATESLQLDAQGTSQGKPIKLDPVKLNSAATIALSDGKPLDITAVRDLSLDLVSSFANVKGGGTPSAMKLDGNVDLTRFYDDVSQFVAMGDLDLKGRSTFSLATAGLPTDLTRPLGVKLNFDSQALTVTQGGKGLLNNENVKGTIDLLLKQTPDVTTITFNKLNVGAESGLFGVWTAGDSMWIALFKSGAIGGDGELHVRSNKLERLAAVAGEGTDPAMRLNRGTVDAVVNFASDTTKNEYKIVSQLDLTRLDVGEILANESFRFGSTSYVPADLSTAHTWFEVASAFAAVKGEANLKLSDPKGATVSPFERVRNATFDGQIPSLPKLYALINSLPSATPVEPALDANGQPLPPLKIDGGRLAFNGKLSRDDAKQTNTLTLNVPSIDGLALSRGEATYRAAEPISLAVAADLTTDVKAATAAQQVTRVLINTLDAKLPGIATVTMTRPIELTNLNAETPKANGEISGNADLGGAGPLLAVVNGANPLPFTGTAKFSQKIASDDRGISLVGSAEANDLAPVAKDAQPLPIRNLQFTNNVAADFKTATAKINQFRAVAPETGPTPLLDVRGSLVDWKDRMQLDGVAADLNWNWATMWKLVQPMVDPEDSMKVEIDGDYKRTWTAQGSLKDLSTLVAQGELNFKTLRAMGLDMTQKGPMSLPVAVKTGVARFAYPDGKPAPDIAVNNGTARLAGIELDVVGMLASAPRKHPLVRNADINEVLANQLGKYASVLFADNSKATGKLDVTIERMNDLPVSDIKSTKGQQGARIAFSVRDLYVDGAVPKGLSMVADLGTEGMRGEIKDGLLVIENGKSTSDVTFTMVRREVQDDARGRPQDVAIGLPLSVRGGISLVDLRLLDTKMLFPTALIKSDELKKYLGDTIEFPVSGLATAPQFKPEDILQAAVRQRLQDPSALIGGLIKGNDKPGAAGDGAAGGGKSGIDVLGGLLGRDKPDEQKDEARPRDDANREDARRDDARREDARRDEARREEARREEAKREDAKREESQPERLTKAQERRQREREEQAKAEADAARERAATSDDRRPREQPTKADERRAREARERAEEQKKADDAKKAEDAKKAKQAAEKKPASDDDDPPAKKAEKKS